MIQKAAREGQDGNPDGSQMNLDDVIIVRESLIKRGDPGERRRISLHRDWDHRYRFQLMRGGQQTLEGVNGPRGLWSTERDLRDEL